ncbi:MAG: DUF2207 domain-containing protein [Coriobacteriales bacterium]|jgi:hypothetical protein|nr:DUF2207 domain-containing protein [Coriobacteriales bacterium]
MPAVDEAFIWTDAASVVAVVCLTLVAIALALFGRFGRRTAPPDARPFRPLEELQHLHPAVIGLLASGRKEVGASEFIATLMMLARAGVLSVESEAQGADEALHIEAGEALRIEADAAAALSNPVDCATVALLRDYLAEDAVIYLSTVRRKSEEDKDGLNHAYAAWKELVKVEAATSVSVPRIKVLVQQALLYGGYALVILALLAGYLLTLTVSAFLLAAAAVLIALGLIMQQNICTEKVQARELGRWLNTLEAHREDVPTDRDSIKLILAYACLFKIAEKAAEALVDTQTAPSVEEEAASLGFWKRLKQEIYADENRG